MTRTSFSVTVASIATAALLFTGCGTSTSVVQVPRSEATTTTVPDDATPDTAPDTTVADTPADTVADAPSDEATTTVPGRVSTGSDEAFCAAAGRVTGVGMEDLLSPGTDLDLNDPAAALDLMKRTMRKVSASLDEMDRVAPPAIADDMHLLATQTATALRSIEAATDFSDILSSSEAMGGVETARASERIARYTLEHCHFSLEGTARN